MSKPASHSFWVLVINGFATSIDAMVVGVGLAIMGADIVMAAAAIGLSTFIMATIGVMLGKVLGVTAGRRAELGGGILSIGIGCLILCEHIGKAS